MRITFAKIRNKAREWSSLHYRLLNVVTYKEYSHRYCQDYFVATPKQYVPVTPVHYVGEEQRKDVIGELPEQFYCVLENVDIIGASNVVIGKKNILYDLLINKKKTYNITDRGLFRVWNTPVHVGNRYVACYKNKGHDIEKGLCMVGNFSGNYYHFIYEILIKWYLLEKIGISDDLPIIVDASARDIPQFAELLSILAKNRNFIYIEMGELRRVKELYYPSMVNFIPPNLKKMEDLVTEDVVFDLDAITYLRSRFLSYMGDLQQNFPKKFFISRKSSKWRQYNEDEVINVVETCGYEVVYPETLTVREQFALFCNADEIVAASGAAFSNIICCSPNTKILMLVSVRVDGAIFSTIAKFLNLNLQYLVGKITNYNNVQSDFEIDCNKLKQILQ